MMSKLAFFTKYVLLYHDVPHSVTVGEKSLNRRQEGPNRRKVFFFFFLYDRTERKLHISLCR